MVGAEDWEVALVAARQQEAQSVEREPKVEQVLVALAYLMEQRPRSALSRVSAVAPRDQVQQGAQKSLQRSVSHRSFHLLRELSSLPSLRQLSLPVSPERYQQQEWHWDRDRAFDARQVAQGWMKQI